MKLDGKFPIRTRACLCILVALTVGFATSASALSEPVLKEGKVLPAPTLPAPAPPGASATSEAPKEDGTQLITFEDGADGTVIQSGIPGVTFSTTDRQDWLYGDVRTGVYNVYPNGNYRCDGNVFAWLGPNQGRGRIDFTQGTASAVTVAYSSNSILYLEAYKADGTLLATTNGPGNTGGAMGSLSVVAPGISYVLVHDSGNYWLIDDVQVSLEDIKLLTVLIPDSNKQEHHATDYQDLVLRRGQAFNVTATTTAGYDPAYYSVGLAVTGPDGREITLAGTGGPNDWYATQAGVTSIGEGKAVSLDLHLPGNAPIGSYSLKARLCQNNGGTVLDTKDCPTEFFVIFNPWSSEDVDVYESSQVSYLNHYVLGGIDYNYYHPTDEAGGASDGQGQFRGAARKWVMGVTDSLVFSKALEAAAGTNTAATAYEALREKVQYGVYGKPESLAGQADTDMLWADWSQLAGWVPGWAPDWGNVPAQIATAHPHGQCMDFSATLAAMARSVGIPARMIACIRSGGWNFHCWTEVQLPRVTPGTWAAGDGTPISPYYHGFGPTSRYGELFQAEVTQPGATAVYTNDASFGGRADIKSLYGVSKSLGLPVKTATPEGVEVSLVPDKQAYILDDAVTVVVRMTNNGTQTFDGNIDVAVSEVHYNGTARSVCSFPPRPASLAPGASVEEPFTFNRSLYESQGQYRISATVAGTVFDSFVRIDDGLDLTANMENVPGEGDLYTVRLTVKNILARDLNDLRVLVYLPAGTDVSPNPIEAGPLVLPAGAEQTLSWPVRFAGRGQTGTICFAYSQIAGSDKANADAN